MNHIIKDNKIGIYVDTIDLININIVDVNSNITLSNTIDILDRVVLDQYITDNSYILETQRTNSIELSYFNLSDASLTSIDIGDYIKCNKINNKISYNRKNKYDILTSFEYKSLNEDDSITYNNLSISSYITVNSKYLYSDYIYASSRNLLVITDSNDSTNIIAKFISFDSNNIVVANTDLTISDADNNIYPINLGVMFLSNETLDEETITVMAIDGSVWVENLPVNNYDVILKDADSITYFESDNNFYYYIIKKGDTNKIFQIQRSKGSCSIIASIDDGDWIVDSGNIFMNSLNQPIGSVELNVYNNIGVRVKQLSMRYGSGLSIKHINYFQLDEAIMYIVKDSVTNNIYKYTYSLSYNQLNNSGSVIFNTDLETFYSDDIVIGYDIYGDTYRLNTYSLSNVDSSVSNITYELVRTNSLSSTYDRDNISYYDGRDSTHAQMNV